MIRFLSGRVLFKDLNAACIDAGGVGYAVRMPLGDLASLGDAGAEAQVHVHTHVREGAIELFGFLTGDGLKLFERLIAVSGVGPKSALAVLSAVQPDELLRAIVSGDEARLTKSPGIGKKTAARIVLELKDKLAKDGLIPSSGSAPKAATGISADLESALLNLGYRPAQVQKAIDGIAPMLQDGAGLEVLVREALKQV